MAVLVTALQFWAILILLLKAFEHISGGKLSPYLTSREIKLHFCFISFHTTLLNTPIETLARRRRRLLTHWFSIGVFFGLLGLLLSLLLLSTNVYLSLLDVFRPLPTPPTPFHPPPPPRTHASALALAKATLRGPSARIPFLHTASRPWWVPVPYWNRISPHDHTAWHAAALTRAARQLRVPDHLRPTRRYSVPYGHAPPPWHHRHPHGPGGPRRRHPGPHRHHRHHRRHPHHSPVPEGHPLPRGPPCKNRQPQTPWNRPLGTHQSADYDRPLAALPAPGSTQSVHPPTHHPKAILPPILDEAAAEADLRANGEKSQITISWRRKPKTVEQPTLKTTARLQANSSDPNSVPNHPRLPPGAQQAPTRTSFLTPLVPGVTVPPGDLWYMIAAVLIAAVLHELGHALAAGMQNARVSGVGGFVALAIPGAYVQLQGIDELAILPQLRVYCAGAWHNLVAAILALAAVGWLPLFMSGLYLTGNGALVVSVPQLSALVGHIEPGDLILKLGRFDVEDGGPSFRLAVSNLILTNDTVGFCVSEDLYRNFSKPKSTCCDEEGMKRLESGADMKHKCFRVQGVERRTSCIDTAVVSTQRTCRISRECNEHEAGNRQGAVVFTHRDGAQEGAESPEGTASVRLDTTNRVAAPLPPGSTHGPAAPVDKDVQSDKISCFLPVLPQKQQLVDVRVRRAQTGEVVHFFYQGYPEVLGQSVTVSSYVPRFWSLAPLFLVQTFAMLDIPNMIERLLQYLSSISLALAILNMAPVFFLDGEASSILFVRLFIPRMSSSTAAVAKQVIVCTGSVLLVLNILSSILEVEGWQ